MAEQTARIDLIGSLALRAGIFYYERLAEGHAAAGRRLDLVLAHADVSTVLAFVAADDKAGLGRYRGAFADRLCDAGTGLVAISAVAPHLAASEVAAAARGPLVNVLDVVVPGLAAAGVGKVAV